MATFSSKIAPSLYMLIFKEHIRLIYNDLKIKRENSQVHSLLQITKLVPGMWQYNKFLDIVNSDKKETKQPLPSRSNLQCKLSFTEKLL